MLRALAAAAVAAVVFDICAQPAHGASCDMTLERALEIARERAPSVLAARARIDEARAQLAGASRLLRSNPEIEADAGPRFSDEGDTTDVRAKLSQAFELGGARAARIDAAAADVAREEASADDAQRTAQREVAEAFLRARAAEELLIVAEDAASVADELQRAAERRHRAGDVAILEVAVARASAAHARAEAGAARAARREAVGKLAVLLGQDVDVPPRPCGPLRAPEPLELPELLRRAPERGDLRALGAEIGAAEAEARLGAARAWPELRIGTEYKREEGDDIYLGGVGFSVPIFDRGEAARAAAEARARRLRLELAAAERAVSADVRTAWEVQRELDAAAGELERVVPELDDAEKLARASYDAGELSLADFLQLRRETLELRRARIEHALAAALARVAVQAQARVLR